MYADVGVGGCCSADVAHLATTDVALKSMNISLQWFAHREQELKMEAASSGELADILQFHFQQMLEQEKQLKTSISQRTQNIYSGNFQTNFIKQLERLHKSLEMERSHFKIQLQTLKNLKESELAQVELVMNLSCFDQIYIANKKLKEAYEQNQNLDLKLRSAQQQEYELKSKLSDAKSQASSIKSNLVSCNTQLSDKESNLVSCNTSLNAKKSDLVSCNTQLSDKELNLVSCNTQLSDKESNLVSCNTTLNAKESDLLSCNTQLNDKESNLVSCNTQLNTKESNLVSCNKQLSTRELNFVSCKTQLNTKESNFVSCNTQLRTKESNLVTCQNQLCNTKSEREGQFRWISNGAITSFTNWHSGEPNNDDQGMKEDCAEMIPLRNVIKWNDRKCSQKKRFICEPVY
ncbi:UNVERIFIED_CONTAM: hypothetical protein B566_EDAN018113 [Ephemera danica]|nr:hypothetical protein B566_EDAN018113 [Ephemera danica]